MRLKTPPYAKAHALAAAAGFAPREGIIVVGGWRLKRCLDWHPNSWHAVCPDDTEPQALDWRWCAGFKVLVIAPRDRGARLDALALAILDSGAKAVYGRCWGAAETYAYGA